MSSLALIGCRICFMPFGNQQPVLLNSDKEEIKMAAYRVLVHPPRLVSSPRQVHPECLFFALALKRGMLREQAEEFKNGWLCDHPGATISDLVAIMA